MEERLYWLAFSAAPGVGPVRFEKLLTTFGSAKDAWNATEREEKEVLGEKVTEQFERFRKSFSLEKYIELLEKKQVWFVTKQDSNYPKRLLEIEKPPFVFYGKGDTEILNNKAIYIGVVGTRKVTSYGKQVTELLSGDLADAGCVIVSGLALGVDAIAHHTTLIRGGITIAVLGSGVDMCYPSTNQVLYEKIISQNGAVISEYALGVPPSVGSFPARNRIIAGISHGVLVTEGAEDSGSLITAENAFSFGRKVFAVPGPITSHVSKGPIKLLQKGAVLVTDAQDIFKALGEKGLPSPKESKKVTGDSPEEQKILALLANEALHFDEIVKRTNFDPQRIGSALSLMEIKGYISITETGAYQMTMN